MYPALHAVNVCETPTSFLPWQGEFFLSSFTIWWIRDTRRSRKKEAIDLSMYVSTSSAVLSHFWSAARPARLTVVSSWQPASQGCPVPPCAFDAAAAGPDADSRRLRAGARSAGSRPPRGQVFSPSAVCPSVCQSKLKGEVQFYTWGPDIRTTQKTREENC